MQQVNNQSIVTHTTLRQFSQLDEIESPETAASQTDAIPHDQSMLIHSISSKDQQQEEQEEEQVCCLKITTILYGLFYV